MACVFGCLQSSLIGAAIAQTTQAFMRMDENLTRFNSLFAGDGPNRLFVYFQAADRAEEVTNIADEDLQHCRE